jgi:hypothetical protein
MLAFLVWARALLASLAGAWAAHTSEANKHVPQLARLTMPLPLPLLARLTLPLPMLARLTLPLPMLARLTLPLPMLARLTMPPALASEANDAPCPC